MTKTDSGSDWNHDDFNLADCYYPQLLRVARSAGLDLSEDRDQDTLIERLDAAGVERVGWNEFMLDGEPLELLPPQTSQGSNGPTDETVLYCLSRESTAEHIDTLRDALETKGYELREAGEESKNYKIVLPAEEQSDAEEIEPDEMTREELYERAQALDIDGRSEMDKEELAAAIQEHQ